MLLVLEGSCRESLQQLQGPLFVLSGSANYEFSIFHAGLCKKEATGDITTYVESLIFHS